MHQYLPAGIICYRKPLASTIIITSKNNLYGNTLVSNKTLHHEFK